MFSKIKQRLLGRYGANIAQRYVVLNGFDGILTVLGITVGAFATQVHSPLVVASACVGTAVGLLVSGVSGAYITEKAQRLRDFKELQAAMLQDLEGSVQEREVASESLLISVLNGLSPFSFALLAVIPYWLAQINVIEMVNTAYYWSMGISAGLLALLGGFLGRIARESIVKYAVKMLLVGGVTVVIMYFLGMGSL